MCAECGWLELAAAIEVHLERTAASHHCFILDAARDVIVANQHATPDQVNAIEAVLEQREGAMR